MQKYLIVTGTVTYALRARDVLRRNNISSRVEKPPKLRSSMGCGYGVVVEGNIDKIKKLLVGSGVKILSVEVMTV